jgi:predicted RNA-binding protein with RPS1 domain
VETFGAFVQIPGFRKQGLSGFSPVLCSNTEFCVAGLVHISQMCDFRVESTEDVVAVDDDVWVKVISVEEGKVSLSMRFVSQTDGHDLDPENEKLGQTMQRRGPNTSEAKPITAEEAVRKYVCGMSGFFPPMADDVGHRARCGKCGNAGHLTTDCRVVGGQKYEMITEDDIAMLPGGGGGGGGRGDGGGDSSAGMGAPAKMYLLDICSFPILFISDIG